jgi:protein TonB
MQSQKTHRSGKAASPRLILPAAPGTSKDQLSSTLFLAGLFHGVILLGVTFSAEDLMPKSEATSLEVVLITNDYEDRAAPDDADLLAQQNRVGAGNTDEQMMLQTALQQTLEHGQIGPEEAGAPDPQREGADQPMQRPTIVAKLLASPAEMPDPNVEPSPNDRRQQTTMPGMSNAIEIINQPEAETLISDFRPRELIISANTREARIAAYLGQWKSKIERMGTLNYPNVAQGGGLARFPTLEVAINSRGELEGVVVLNSSGEQTLDRAAVDIVTMAAPFDPFPEFLRTDYDLLRFAYEWRFTDGFVSSTIKDVESY